MWRKHWWLPRLSSSIVNEIDLSLHHVKVLLYWCYDIRYLSFWWVVMENAHVYFETYVLEVSLKMKKENQHENCWAKQKKIEFLQAIVTMLVFRLNFWNIESIYQINTDLYWPNIMNDFDFINLMWPRTLKKLRSIVIISIKFSRYYCR